VHPGSLGLGDFLSLLTLPRSLCSSRAIKRRLLYSCERGWRSGAGAASRQLPVGHLHERKAAVVQTQREARGSKKSESPKLKPLPEMFAILWHSYYPDSLPKKNSIFYKMETKWDK